MKSIETKVDRVIVGKIEPEEEIFEKIIELVKTYDIKAGLINVIGAFKKFTIGYFDLSKNEYNFKTFEENVELLTCMGNISHKDGEPIIHIHVTLGKEDYSIMGGHLSSPSVISITGEVFIYEIAQKLNRAVDPQFGLSLLDI